MAAGAGSFKRILQVLEKWPVQKSKSGRDFGEYLTNKVTAAYKQNQFENNHSNWDKQYLALNRLVGNEHRNKYPRNLASSATGLNSEQCSLALSNDMLEVLQEEDKPVLKKIFSVFKSSKE